MDQLAVHSNLSGIRAIGTGEDANKGAFAGPIVPD